VRARGSARQSSRARRRRNGRSAPDGRDAGFRSPPLDPIQRARRRFVRQPPSQAVVSSRGTGRLLAHGSGSAGHVRELSFSDVLVKAAPGCLSRPSGSGRPAASHARSSPNASMATAQHACSPLHECERRLLTAVSARIPAQLRSARTGPIGHTTNCRRREVPCGKLRSSRRWADVRTSKRRECGGRGRRRSTCRCGSSRRDARRARDGAPQCGLSPGGSRGSR
jgi:hypothetical protein